MQPSKRKKDPERGTVGSEHPSKRKPDKHVVSGHSPVLPDDVGLAVSAVLGGADAYRNTRIRSCDCPPMIWFCAPHICKRRGRAGRLRGIAAITRSKVKKPFHRLLLKLVHPDCRLSERRFNFHSMRVSGEKTALVQIANLRALTERVSRRSTTMVL